MHFFPSARALFVASCTFALAGCGGGGSTSTETLIDPPAAPGELVAFEDDAAVTLAWTEVENAEGYDLLWSTAEVVDPASASRIDGVSSPYTHTGLENNVTYSYVAVAHNPGGTSAASNQTRATPVANTGLRYDPLWRDAVPSQTISFTYNSAQTSAQNGTALANVIAGLLPGQKLKITGGTYTFTSAFTITAQGTAAFPIWITAANNATVKFTRTGTTLPVVAIGGTGSGPTAQYLCLRGIEITGGSFGVDLLKATQVWIDRCHVHHVGGAGLHAMDEHTSYLFLTRNDIHDTASWGEGIALGNNANGKTTHHSVIALNHVHDTRGAFEGDGIDLRRGSYANWIVENRVHHTKYPAIMFHGTNGQQVNVIERNVCYDTQDNVMQAEGGEAIVRNNVLVGPCLNKIFDSSHSEATLRNLTVVHNTMFAQAGYAAGLFAWNGQPNLVFANNVVYSNPVGTTGYAIAYRPGYAGGTLTGNVIIGYTPDVTTGFTIGAGLSDFMNVTGWSQPYIDLEHLRPRPTSAMVGAANAPYVAVGDIEGTIRTPPVESGALEAH